MLPRLVIAAPGSGSGKTTLTAGLIGALRARGLAVQPFKCGPDYIDPGYHTLAAGRACRNLDTWLLGPSATRALFARASAGADLALIEGVMGLFDGAGAHDEAGSTADVARLLGAPVLLVVDARGMARSAAALVAGFVGFDRRLRIGGVLLNRVGGERHAALCASAIAEHCGVPCLGYLARAEELRLPERHLGLVTTAEGGPWAAVLAQAAERLADSCDLDAIIALARSADDGRGSGETGDALVEESGVRSQESGVASDAPATAPLPRQATVAGPVIAVARDAAFSFIYPETCELLEQAGAAVVPFSPLEDRALPPGTAGLILSGGFPELYAEALSRNGALLAAIRALHAAGAPIYAECGGLMYLTEELVDLEGRRWPMAGLLPGRSVMSQRLTLGYRTARAAQDGPLLAAGAAVRGHEFHYSRWEGRPADLTPAYTLVGRDGSAGPPEGAQLGGLVASYVHLHWLAQPLIARRFVERCAAATPPA